MSYEEDKIFEEIIEASDLRKWLEDHKQLHQLTIGDIYEGISIISQAQVELHQYLMAVMGIIYENNQAGQIVKELPKVTSRQVMALVNIFENAAIFIEDF